MSGLGSSGRDTGLLSEDSLISTDDVVEVRATGRTPEAVAEEVRQLLSERNASGWRLNQVQPIIYNSSTTGYLLLFFVRQQAGGPR